jgi:hypothetical protein
VTQLQGNSVSAGGIVSSDGGSPVTYRGIVYDTISNPSLSSNYTVDGSGTGTFVSTITNLAPTTTYYTRAYATNALGTAYGNIVSFTTTITLPIVSLGQNHAGGIVFYIDQTGQHGLVCAPMDQGSAPWGLFNVSVQGTSHALGSGAQNTSVIMGYNNSGYGAFNSASAALLCDTLQLNGYSDWFLPSSEELTMIRYFLHSNGIGNFNSSSYWSSSVCHWETSCFLDFNSNGGVDLSDRRTSHLVRAVRAF